MIEIITFVAVDTRTSTLLSVAIQVRQWWQQPSLLH
jgi:hypothetical protein